MATEDVFDAFKTGLLLLHGYRNAVAQEIGMERALALMSKTCETMGAMRGKMMKEQSGIKQFDAKTARSLLRSGGSTVSMSSEVTEETPKRAAWKVGRCAVYEAAQILGTDAALKEATCRASSIRMMDAIVKQLNPGLSFRLRKFRSAEDDSCDEEIVLG